MVFWVLIALSLFLLWVCRPREQYVDVLDSSGKVIGGPGTRPSLQDAAWRSKIEASAPIGGNTTDYEKSIQGFYDTIYAPLRTENPTASVPAQQVEAFISAQPNTMDKKGLRQLIISGFAVERSGTAASREEEQLNTEDALKGFKAQGGSEAIEPKEGVPETWPQYRDVPEYKPSDTRKGNLPEGIYSPVYQTVPRREGTYDDNSTSWNSGQFYNVCKGEKCSKNVL